ncbi:MAG: hypothetical protein AMJ42_06680 [Deltaproteobacteria bacterium DG_8]|nr:MAG: hypothetical protein AMJ42_06680 [Deltaproteobacteria bacterium DG_8]
MELSDLISDMRVVTVSGAHKGVGKTILAELILNNLSGFAAIKITMSNLYTSVSDKEEEIMVPEKDTFRMKRSGAEKVVWVRATERLLLEAMEQALTLIDRPKGLLIEGNSILNHLSPTIAFFVIDSTLEHMKPSRISALKKADVCIVNQRSGSTISRETLQKVKSINPKMKIFSFDLLSANSRKNEDFEQLMKYIKKHL